MAPPLVPAFRTQRLVNLCVQGQPGWLRKFRTPPPNTKNQTTKNPKLTEAGKGKNPDRAVHIGKSPVVGTSFRSGCVYSRQETCV